MLQQTHLQCAWGRDRCDAAEERRPLLEHRVSISLFFRFSFPLPCTKGGGVVSHPFRLSRSHLDEVDGIENPPTGTKVEFDPTNPVKSRYE